MSLTIDFLRKYREHMMRQPVEEFFEITLVWYRRPRSKKKRIREKWRRDLRNYRGLDTEKFDLTKAAGCALTPASPPA